MKITVAFIFVYALARKSNKDFYDLQDLKKGLERKVDEKTKDLQIAKEKIEKASEQQRNYFINLAHETKTPLTLISNYLDRYMKNNSASNDLNIIKENFEKLKQDMLRYLDVEKYEKGHIVFEHDGVIDLSNFILKKIPVYTVNASENDISFSSEIEDNIHVKADISAIESVINNLFDNAIKYSKAGGSIKVILKKLDKYVELIVIDNGIGIEKEKVKNIFKPYYQISNQKTNKQGLGMGMFIVKNIIDSLGGIIEIESEPNVGTTFIVKIPVELNIVRADKAEFIEEKKIPVKKQINSVSYQIEKNNILVVEDNRDMRDYLRQELSADYNVLCALNGKEALDMMKEAPQIHLIISDVMMDEMDGYQFHEIISKREPYSRIPFIFLTARSDDSEKIKFLTEGVCDYIYKPFSMEEIKAKIHSILVNTQNQRNVGLKYAVTAIQNQINGSFDDAAKNKWTVFEARKNQYDISDRQTEIIKLVEQGLEYKEIADKLNISIKTVHRHIQNIFEKVNAHSKIELIKTLFE